MGLLNLELWIPQKDVRKLIFGLLDRLDGEMVMRAHGSTRLNLRRCNWVCLEASKHGYLSLLEWLEHIGTPLSQACIDFAIIRGHLETFCWLQSKNIGNTLRAMTLAITNGHIHIVQYLISCGYHVQFSGLSLAIQRGHLKMVRWLHDEQFFSPPTIWAMEVAARHDQLEIIKWLQSVGCEWDSRIIVIAYTFSYWHIIDWLIANGCPCTDELLQQITDEKKKKKQKGGV